MLYKKDYMNHKIVLGLLLVVISSQATPGINGDIRRLQDKENQSQCKKNDTAQKQTKACLACLTQDKRKRSYNTKTNTQSQVVVNATDTDVAVESSINANLVLLPQSHVMYNPEKRSHKYLSGNNSGKNFPFSQPVKQTHKHSRKPLKK